MLNCAHHVGQKLYALGIQFPQFILGPSALQCEGVVQEEQNRADAPELQRTHFH